LTLDTTVVVCPIVREQDGLALSSRNAYLKGVERRAATALYRSLVALRCEVASGERDAARLRMTLRGLIEAEPGVALDYAEIVDTETLEPVLSLRRTCYALIAARVGSARLIDNALIEQEGDSFRVLL
jgi:pantoate--beta-alanine ligase